MNKITYIVLVLIVFSCSSNKSLSQNIEKDAVSVNKKTKNLTADSIRLEDNKSIYYYKSLLTKENIEKQLQKLTSKAFQEEKAGKNGQELTANYIADFYKNLNYESPIGEDQYFQNIPAAFFNGKETNSSENVMAFIYGIEKPEEVVIVSANYSQEKESDNTLYGTVALLEIAKVFRTAYLEDEGPKRSILFLNLTSKEKDFYGLKYYAEYPVFPFKKTAANLNINMIGKIDKAHQSNENHLYLIGSDELSEELHFISEAVNNKYTQLDLDYKMNTKKYKKRFDFYNFAKKGVPTISYVIGNNQSINTEDNINYELLAKQAQFIFLTAWELANRPNFLKRDNEVEGKRE